METLYAVNLSPTFVAWLEEIAAQHGKTAEQVYALWKLYCRDCQNFDQSPVQSEFLNWYAKQLAA